MYTISLLVKLTHTQLQAAKEILGIFNEANSEVFKVRKYVHIINNILQWKHLLMVARIINLGDYKLKNLLSMMLHQALVLQN